MRFPESRTLAMVLACVTACTLSATAVAQSGATYTEAVNGDLSNSRFSPTLFPLAGGVNTITGTFGRTGVPDVHDLDYITITVPAGSVLERFVLSSVDIGGAVSFIGMQTGPQITVPPNTFDSSPLLGWTHFGNGDLGRDLLPAIGAGPGAMGFVPPLPSGVYALWIMELDTASVYSYSFSLTVTTCPTIQQQPMNVRLCSAVPIVLQIATQALVSFQWQVERTPGTWIALSDGLTASGSVIQGATAPMLTILSPSASDAAAYRCVLTTACGSLTSDPAVVIDCPADFNCDAVANSADFFDYITAFFDESPSADFNADGSVGSQDFFDFLSSFFAGC